MNSKLALFSLCIVAITSGCESTPSYSSYATPYYSPYTTSSLPAPVSINEICPEGTVAKTVSDMRNMSTIECIYNYLPTVTGRATIVANEGNRVAGIPVVR